MFLDYINMYSLLLCSLLALSGLVSCDEESAKSNVLVFTTENFQAGIETNENVLVEFYAPWCGHCKGLEPIYEETANLLAEKNSNIKLAKVDAIENKQLAEQYQIRGYPTLKFFRKGKAPIDYSGDRKPESFISWLEKKSGTPAKILASVEELKEFQEANSICVVGYFKDPQSEKAKLFTDVADTIDHHPFAIISIDQAFKDQGIEEDSKIVLFKQFDEGKAIFDGELDEANLKKFVIAESLPLIVDFNQDTATKIFGGEFQSHLLLFLSQSSGHYDTLLEGAKSIVKEFRDKILFVSINADEEEHGRILDFFGLKKEEIPSMRIIKLADDMVKFKPEKQDFSAENIKSFVSDFIEGKLKQHLLSQELPEDWDKKAVKVLVASNFADIAYDKSKDVLVEFYAPWCGHCKQLEPIYDQLGESLKEKDDIVVAKMDATINELEDTKILSFPTIKLYKKGDNKVVQYNGERTLEGLSKFIESGGEYGKAPAEAEEEDEDDDLPRKDEL
ncbi:protein disulfide-isomerase isoform X2 [Nilaparvata lugens]|uniref:protein disulfide-isomerase isoform X2 n=1 Tax=Nilaparvata lugens TaxID=108931 RepID=UPI00193EA87F|nr:protein disulfide-isomerase isoform X2 [Nilaparvata lugens]